MLGGPGSGKGTQLQRLCSHLGLPGISVGEILRKAIASDNFLGKKAKPYVEKGELVPDELMIQLMRLRLLQADTQSGWIMEGYPRTAFQAEELDFVLADFGQELDKAILLQIDEAMMIERSKARSRRDDTLEIIKRRIELFKERTVPILEYYEPREKLLRVNGNQTPDAVAADIRQQLS
ncbi:MAG: nucleoside monophosphate kinase [Jaaginema sp. PMC 1078.18]|nr:nucleoside monophosphate kinase [Jaaginema sp. PMC 1078.18]